MRQVGAKRPAKPAARSAPAMMPNSITEVTSLNTLPSNSARRSGVDQYGQLQASIPIPSAIFEPQSAKAEVMPQGRPDRARVAKLPIASTTAPATSGQGPRGKRANPERGAG